MTRQGVTLSKALRHPLFKGINGCYYNVGGLPVNLLKDMAKEINIDLF